MVLVPFETRNGEPVAIRADAIRYISNNEGCARIYYDEPDGTTSWVIVNVSVQEATRIANRALEFSRNK